MSGARDLSKFLVLLALAAAACGEGTRNNAPPPPPADGGGAVSFAQDIQPIFNSQCASCHNSTTARGSLDLTSPGSYQRLVNVASSASCSAQVPGVPRVKPGDTMGSMLWRKTKPDPSKCLNAMPNGTLGLGVIAPDQFAKIEAWIQQGALNN